MPACGEDVTVGTGIPDLPEIVASATEVAVFAGAGGAAPEPQTVSVTSANSVALVGLSLSVTHPEGSPAWLTVVLDGTAAPTTIMFTSTTDGLAAAVYTATVLVTSSTAGVQPVELTATLTLAGFVVQQTDGATVVSENGGTDDVAVSLATPTTSSVVLTVSNDTPTAATVSPETLTFRADDWSSAQTVTVTGVDDSAPDGDRISTVTISVDADASDPAFAALPSETVSVTTIDEDDTALDLAVEFAVQQMTRSISELSTSQHARATRGSDGTWTSTGASSWTSGFFAGTQWLLYELTGDASWRTRAEAQTAALAGQELNGADHDIGFRIMTSFGQGYRLTGSASYRERILTAARTFAGLYNSRIGMTRSFLPRTLGANLACRDPVSARFPVIMDNMINLELFFRAAAEGGDPEFHEMAVSHALRTMEHHLRPDGSHFHFVDFDTATAAVRFKGTHQGYCDDTTWARGQSWAVYGFTMVYRYTQDSRFLDAARQAADYFIDHLPADRVPYWDFELPSTGAGTPREASAAAVAAAGLLELAGHVPGADRYRNAAVEILEALASPTYLADGTPHRSILLHSNANVNTGSEVDVGHIYADYYFLEAILRYREMAR